MVTNGFTSRVYVHSNNGRTGIPFIMIMVMIIIIIVCLFVIATPLVIADLEMNLGIPAPMI